jgi:hypothetical protein
MEELSGHPFNPHQGRLRLRPALHQQRSSIHVYLSTPGSPDSGAVLLAVIAGTYRLLSLECVFA